MTAHTHRESQVAGGFVRPVPQWLAMWVEVVYMHVCVCVKRSTASRAWTWWPAQSLCCLCVLTVCFCVPAQLLIYLLHRLRCRLHLSISVKRKKCAAACWASTPCNTHTHSLIPKLLKYSFPVKKSALANVLLLSKPALTDALKAPPLWGQGTAFIRPQMVSSVSPPNAHSCDKLTPNLYDIILCLKNA